MQHGQQGELFLAISTGTHDTARHRVPRDPQPDILCKMSSCVFVPFIIIIVD